ncbi:MAG: hypothetical protein V3R51_07585 [Gammaproteobacteria bacterium]
MASQKEIKLRRQVALEAARIMARGSVQDFLAAKRKAVSRLGISEARFLPRNIEIKNALADYQHLFQSETQSNQLRSLRETALEAMHFFSAYEPRLVGEVLDGIANQYSDVTLHLFSDTVEDVELYLMQKQISYITKQRRVRTHKDEYKQYPVFKIMAGDHCVELVVFPVNGLRQAPCSSVDDKPMGRASLATVKTMISDAGRV